jgi:glucosamine-6-phosphate deaminase
MSIRVIVRESPLEIAKWVADHIVDRAESRSLAVLGVATGSSPSAVYRALAAAESEAIRGLEVFALDEYVGLPYSRNESYHAVVESEIRAPLGLAPAKVHVPGGMAADLDEAADAYERELRDAGGVGLQIVGIGSNGHIAFNEPGSSFDSRTRVVTLNEQTRADNARFFADANEVPATALTQGIGTIMEAREIVLIANGVKKAEAIARAIEGQVDPQVPASVLQNHGNVTIALDEVAASALTARSRSLLVSRA